MVLYEPADSVNALYARFGFGEHVLRDALTNLFLGEVPDGENLLAVQQEVKLRRVEILRQLAGEGLLVSIIACVGGEFI